MAKISGQDVPIDLQTLWAALVAPGKITQGADGSIKIKKNKKKPNKPPRRDLDLVALQSIAKLVEKEHFTDLGKTPPQDFVFNLTRELLLGIFDPEYFVQCEVESAATLESVPTYSADLNPPPYGFRTPLFMPSVPVYPNGTPTASPPTYTGQKIGTLFADTLLRWRKIVFKAKAIDKNKGEERVLMRWDTTITIDATSRGSRPMFSLHVKGAISTDTGGALSSTEPPIMFKTSLYWRFKLPPTTPPYFNTYQVRRIVKPFARFAKKTGTGLFTRYVLNASNRPMMGRGYNNNDSVETSFSGDPELWEIRSPCIPYNLAQGNNWIWQESALVEWEATLLSAVVYIDAARNATANISMRLTHGETVNDISISQALSGSWNWLYDRSGTNSDGAPPKSAPVRVIDASCDGSKVILHVGRSNIDYKDAARGFLLLAITSPSSAVVSTLADTTECNPLNFVRTKHDYGIYGLQIDTYDLAPHTVWCWFTKQHTIAKIQFFEHTFVDYLSGVGYTEKGIKVDGVTKSVYHVDYLSGSQYAANLDGYSDGGRLSGGSSNGGQRDKPKAAVLVFDMYNTRLSGLSILGVYAGLPPLVDEIAHPNGIIEFKPFIVESRSIRLRLGVFHYTPPGGTGLWPLGSLPAYKLSDYYFGKTVTPSAVLDDAHRVTVAP